MLTVYRVKAFLRLLREWAVGTNPEGGQYNHLWQTPIHGSRTLPNGTVVFNDMNIHPWAVDLRATHSDLEKANNDHVDSSSGAYGFSLAQWWNAVESGQCPGTFTNTSQDIMAIFMLLQAQDGRGVSNRTALACIREGGKGNFKKAINLLLTPNVINLCPNSLMNMPKDWSQTVTHPTMGTKSLDQLWTMFQQFEIEESKRR